MPEILTGVETDIISENGDVTTTDKVLEKLDLVIASLHWRTWIGFQGTDSSNTESRRKILKAYSSITNNSHIDILGHPTRFPESLKRIFKGEDFIEIFELMKKKDMAVELNLSQDLSRPEYELEREVFKAAGEVNVPIAIGSDFHNLKGFDFPGYFTEYVSKDNWQEAFKYNHKSGWHSRLFRFLTRNIKYLKDAGIKTDQIINSNYENFKDWYQKKNS